MFNIGIVFGVLILMALACLVVACIKDWRGIKTKAKARLCCKYQTFYFIYNYELKNLEPGADTVYFISQSTYLGVNLCRCNTSFAFFITWRYNNYFVYPINTPNPYKNIEKKMNFS